MAFPFHAATSIESTMNGPGRHAHWENVYTTKDEHSVSWFQERPDISLDLIHSTGVKFDAAIIDIGGGASRLADALLPEGFTDITILDLSEKALAISQARLGGAGASIDWIAADVTTWEPQRRYDVWHDRAALHFLTDATDRAAYVERLKRAVKAKGHIIIATFAPDGPERCSGLPIVRHDAASIGALLGSSFKLIEERRHDHQTPGGNIQRFQFSRFQREG